MVSREHPAFGAQENPPKRRGQPNILPKEQKEKILCFSVLALFDVVILANKMKQVNDFVKIKIWGFSGVSAQKGFENPKHYENRGLR